MQGTTVTANYGAAAEKLTGMVYWMLQDGQPGPRQLLNSSQWTEAVLPEGALRSLEQQA